MPRDLINDISANEFKREIEPLICQDNRALPPQSKLFAAVAKLQKFDQLPDLQSFEVVDKMIAEGGVELNRGFSGKPGIPSILFAKELAKGALYPGTLTAYGNGIYLSTCSLQGPNDFFPKLSGTSIQCTKGDGVGAILRATCRKDVKSIEYDDLKATFREFKNRAHQAGVRDMGVFAAALGFDLIVSDSSQLFDNEHTYVVLNRAILTIQNSGLKVQPEYIV